MKKLILLTGILCVLNLTMLKAQTEQGTFLLGLSSSIGLSGPSTDLTSLEFSTSKEKSDGSDINGSGPVKFSSFNLSPKIGCFVVNNLVVGIDMNLSLSSSKDYSYYTLSTINTNLYSAGPFVRYYIPTGKVSPFFELEGSFGGINNKEKYSGGIDEYKQKKFLTVC